MLIVDFSGPVIPETTELLSGRCDAGAMLRLVVPNRFT
jgi:hypothetical protein